MGSYTKYSDINQITNGDFANWTGDDPDDWTVYGESEPDKGVTEVSGKCRMYKTTGTACFIYQPDIFEAGKNYQININITSDDGGAIALQALASNLGSSSSIITYSSAGQKTTTYTGESGYPYFRILIGNDSDFTFDDVEIFEEVTVETRGVTINPSASVSVDIAEKQRRSVSVDSAVSVSVSIQDAALFQKSVSINIVSEVLAKLTARIRRSVSINPKASVSATLKEKSFFGDVKYVGYFRDDNGVRQGKIEILEDGYSGSVTELQGTGKPIRYRTNDASDKLGRVITGREAIYSFYATQAETETYDEFLTDPYKKKKLKYYPDGTNLEFVGWLKPENTNRSYHDPSVQYDLVATDGLADLKYLDFLDINGEVYTDRTSILTIVKRGLDLIGIDDCDIFTQCNTIENSMPAESDPIKEGTEDNRRFHSIESGEIRPWKAYKVLEECVKIFHCRLFQNKGQWWIVNDAEPNSYRVIYNYSDLSVKNARASHNRRVAIDIQAGSDKFKPYNSSWRVGKIEPIKKLRVQFTNKNLGDSESFNGDFENGTTGWTNVGWDQFFTSNFGEGSKYLNTTEITVNSDIKSFYGESFNIGTFEPGDKLKVSYRVKLKSITFSTGDTEKPMVYSGLKRGTYPVQKGTKKTISEVDGEWNEYIDYYEITETGSHVIYFYIEPQSPTSQLTVRWDDIDYYQERQADEVTFDRVYIHENTKKAYLEEEIEIFFGDSIQTSDIGALQYGGVNTQSWSRYNKSEGLPIQQILAQQIMNDYATFKDRIQVDIYDPDYEITYGTVLIKTIDAITHNYRFINFSRDDKTNVVSGDMVEILLTEIDIISKTQLLTSIDGKDTTVSDSPVQSETYWTGDIYGIYTINKVGIGRVPDGSYDLEVNQKIAAISGEDAELTAKAGDAFDSKVNLYSGNDLWQIRHEGSDNRLYFSFDGADKAYLTTSGQWGGALPTQHNFWSNTNHGDVTGNTPSANDLIYWNGLNWANVNRSNFIDNKIGGKGVNPNVTSPGAGEDGYVISWDNTNLQYKLISGGGSVTTWLGLTDTDPTTYTGNAGKYVRVNSTPDGLEFYDLVSYIDANLGGQTLDSTITSPGAGEDGYVVSWDNANSKYKLVAGGGGGVTTWLALTDTDPTSFTGQAGKYVRVNSTPDGLEFYDLATYIDAHLGGQDLNSNVTSPGASQDGYSLTWDNTAGEFVLSNITGGTSGSWALSGTSSFTANVVISGAFSYSLIMRNFSAFTIETDLTISGGQLYLNASGGHNEIQLLSDDGYTSLIQFHSGSDYWRLVHQNTNAFQFAYNGAEKATLDTSGNLSIDGSFTMGDGVGNIKTFINTHLGGKNVSNFITAPSASEDGYSVVWDNGANQYTLSNISGTGTYTDEQAQDAVGNILADTSTIDATYTDATPEIKFDARVQMSITSDANGLKLSGDLTSPGNDKYYGTDASGVKGWWSLPSGGGASSFLGLTDTPAGYGGQALRYVRVNSGETGLEYYDLNSYMNSHIAGKNVSGLVSSPSASEDGYSLVWDNTNNQYTLSNVSGGTGGGSPGGATDELQKKDSLGAFAGAKVFRSTNNTLQLGDTSVSGDQTVSVSSATANANLRLKPYGSGYVYVESNFMYLGYGNPSTVFIYTNSGVDCDLDLRATSGFIRLNTKGVTWAETVGDLSLLNVATYDRSLVYNTHSSRSKFAFSDGSTWKQIEDTYIATLSGTSGTINVDCKMAKNVQIYVETSLNAHTVNLSNNFAGQIIELIFQKNAVAGQNLTITLGGSGLTYRGPDDSDYQTTPQIICSGDPGNYHTIIIRVTQDVISSNKVCLVDHSHDYS